MLNVTIAELRAHLTVDQRAELFDLLARFATDGPKGLPPRKYKPAVRWRTGRAPRGEPKLFMLKTSGATLVGMACESDGCLTLVVTAVDRRRKNDNAGRALREAAGAEAIRVKAFLEERRR